MIPIGVFFHLRYYDDKVKRFFVAFFGIVMGSFFVSCSDFDEDIFKFPIANGFEDSGDGTSANSFPYTLYRCFNFTEAMRNSGYGIKSFLVYSNNERNR